MDIFRIRMSAPSSPSFGPATLPVEGDVLLDRYRVIRQLGAGGMGVVYEAVNLRTGRRVAIKCLNPESALDPVALRRFEGEARGATSIGNPHIVDVIDMDALPNGVHFIVLEYLDGTELGRELKTHGPFQVRRAVSIVLQMCEALAPAHEKGIIHRDLKPANVFLIDRDGNPDYVKILDFGISKFREPGSDAQSLTETGKILGTPLYMAPEQMLNAKGASPRADLYALGCILFAALTGRPPFVAENLVELFVKVQKEPLPDVRSLRPDVPRELAAIVHKLLARDPDERFEDCVSLRSALLPYIGRPSVGTGVEFEDTRSAPTPSIPTPKRTRGRTLAVGAVFLAAASFAAAMRHASEQRRPAPIEPRPAPDVTPIVTPPFPITALPSRIEPVVVTSDVPVPIPLPHAERFVRRRPPTEQTPRSVPSSAPPTVRVRPPAPVAGPAPSAPVQPVAQAVAIPTLAAPSTHRPNPMDLPPPREMPERSE